MSATMRVGQQNFATVSIVLCTTVFAALCQAQTQAPAAAATTPQEAAIERQIRELATQWSKAVQQRDVATLEQIWASDFIYVEPSGKSYNKAEGIAGVKNSTDEITSVETTTVDVRVFGGGTVAVDIGTYREMGRDKQGRSFDRSSRFTNIWSLKAGVWQCDSGHASALPSTAGDTIAVNASLTAFHEALNKLFTGDVAPMKAVWSHAADTTYMGPVGGLQVGWSKIDAYWDMQAAKKLGGKVDAVDVHVTVGSDMAVAHYVEKGENIIAGKPQPVSIRSTTTFRKENGQWLVIGHHTDTLAYLQK